MDSASNVPGGKATREQLSSTEDRAIPSSELYYRQLFETAQDGILIVDAATGQILDANLAMRALLGRSNEELKGMNFGEIIPFKGRSELKNLLADLRLKKTVRYEAVQLDAQEGLQVIVEFIGTAFLADRRRLVQCNLRDITERKRIEEQFHASFQEVSELKIAMDEHVSVTIINTEGKFTYVNDRFCQISQYSREELLGQDHTVITSGHHSREFFNEMWTTLESGRVWKGEIMNKARDGSFFWAATTYVPFLDELGEPRQFVAIRADITKRKAVERSVVERTEQLKFANKELEAFCYSVSHDLRAPLRHILGFVNLLHKDIEPLLSEKNLRYLSIVTQSAQRMGKLIDDLLAFSRVGRTDMHKSDVNLVSLVQENLEDFQIESTQRNILWEISPLPHVCADRALLRMVFANLISNAVKFTSVRANAKIEIGCAPGGDAETVIFIRDNGAGFDPKYMGKLFGVFQRLHSQEEFEGTGIGLANVQRIIQRHGGRIWAEGILNSGATFYFSIPK